MSVLIYGDPQGLRTFSKLLVAVAALNQKDIPDQNLPVGVGHHLHLKPVEQLNRESLPLIVGRLDGKGTREFTNIEPLVKRRNKKPKRIVENLNR